MSAESFEERFDRTPEAGKGEVIDALKEHAPESPTVIAIFISPGKGEPMQQVDAVRAIAGLGLEGDRYKVVDGTNRGTYREHRIPNIDRQVTFISEEGIDDANRELQAAGVDPFGLEDTRRNVVVTLSNAHLNSLIGQRFSFGGLLFEGVEECTPCRIPAKSAGRARDGKAFESAFKDGRGGLRARILTGGNLRVGDHFSQPEHR